MENTYYISKEQFEAVKAAWKTRTDRSAWEHIIYNILRSKPADLGFCEKTKNIQGDNPWFGFNSAARGAFYHSKNINFKGGFGIEMPEGFADKLKGIRK